MQRRLTKFLPKPLLRLAERAENSPLGKRLLYGFSWSIVGAFVSRIFAILSSLVVARVLGREDFGEFGIIQGTVGMFQIFAGFSLGLTASKYVAQYYRSDPERTGQIVAMSGMVSAITGGAVALTLFFSSQWLAKNTLAAPHLGALLCISSISLFIGALNGAQVGALTGFEAFKSQTFLLLFNGFLSPIILIVGVMAGGLHGVVWGVVVAAVCNWGMTHLVLRKVMLAAGIPFRFSGAMTNLKILRDFSLPAVISGLMVTPVNWACNALLVNQPGGYSQMGIYNAAMQWFNAVMFFPGVIGNVVTPILSERFEAKDNRSMSRVLIVSMKANGLVAFVVVFVGVLFSPLIMKMYGEEYAAGWKTLVIVLLTAGLLAVQTPVGQIIAASGRMWTGFAMNMAWGGMFIVLSYILIAYGAFGLASARFIAYMLHATWTFYFAYKIIKNNNGGVIE